MKAIALTVTLALAAFPVSAESKSSGLGQRLVETNCSPCHAVGRTGDSPNAAAPPFRIVVTRYEPEALEEALAEGIMVGHPDMPEFELTPREIDAVVAYLKTLRR